jgi:hypothetical protein
MNIEIRNIITDSIFSYTKNDYENQLSLLSSQENKLRNELTDYFTHSNIDIVIYIISSGIYSLFHNNLHRIMALCDIAEFVADQVEKFISLYK